MVSLTDEQVELVRQEILNRGISLPDLQVDLLDHMCCILENELSEGDDFVTFFHAMLPRFFHDNLHEIQVATEQSITNLKITVMQKQLTQSYGVAAALLIVASILKIGHWAGASAMMVLGMGIAIVLSIPLMLITVYRAPVERTAKLLLILAAVLVTQFTCGILFKVQRWPLATMLMLTAVIEFILLYIPVYFYYHWRNSPIRWIAGMNSFLLLVTALMLFMLFDLKAL